MTAYLIEVADTKEGVLYPTTVGPFADSGEAAAFAEKYEMGTSAQAGDGGYSAVHVIDDDCRYSPQQYEEAFSWRLDEDD